MERDGQKPEELARLAALNAELDRRDLEPETPEEREQRLDDEWQESADRKRKLAQEALDQWDLDLERQELGQPEGTKELEDERQKLEAARNTFWAEHRRFG